MTSWLKVKCQVMSSTMIYNPRMKTYLTRLQTNNWRPPNVWIRIEEHDDPSYPGRVCCYIAKQVSEKQQLRGGPTRIIL